MIYFAREIEPNENGVISVSYSRFLKVTGISTPIKKDFEKMMKDITGLSIETNTIQKGGLIANQKMIVLIPTFKIINNIINFELSKDVMNVLRSRKEMKDVKFGTIHLPLLKVIKNKYALNLYLLVQDYNKLSHTKEISITQIRKTLGVKKESFSDFSSLREKVLNRAINELAKFGFKLKLITYRKGREIKSISFQIIQKPIHKNQVKTKIVDMEVVETRRELTDQEKEAIYYIMSKKEDIKNKRTYFNTINDNLIDGHEDTIENVNNAIKDIKVEKEIVIVEKALILLDRKIGSIARDGATFAVYAEQSKIMKEKATVILGGEKVDENGKGICEQGFSESSLEELASDYGKMFGVKEGMGLEEVKEVMDQAIRDMIQLRTTNA